MSDLLNIPRDLIDSTSHYQYMSDLPKYVVQVSRYVWTSPYILVIYNLDTNILAAPYRNKVLNHPIMIILAAPYRNKAHDHLIIIKCDCEC